MISKDFAFRYIDADGKVQFLNVRASTKEIAEKKFLRSRFAKGVQKYEFKEVH